MMHLFEIPEWNRGNDRLWEMILRKNVWFVRLRYFAVIFMLFFILLGKSGLVFFLGNTQVITLFSCLLYTSPSPRD